MAAHDPGARGQDSGMTQSLLAFADVHAGFAGRKILRGVTFQVDPGVSTALVGLNGAGKSTLLRLALDLIAPSSGSITLKGKPAHHPSARQHLAYLPERFNSPHFLTGGELLASLLRLHGIPYSRHAAAEECERLGLPDAVLEQRARLYSKGMHQTLGLVACLLTRREFLVLDEPMSGLDPLTFERFCARLREAQTTGVTLFFSSHAPNMLDQLCERVILLQEGEIAFDGTPAALGTLYPRRATG